MSSHRGESRGRRPPTGALPRIRLLAAALLVLLSGCEYPTGLPKWMTEWLAPLGETSIGAAELLPERVASAPDGSAFDVSVDPITISRSLGELCGAPCLLASGTTVPKPAFVVTLRDSLKLPAEVTSATLAGGTVVVGIATGLSFDPVRPSASERGSITVTLTSAGRTLATLPLGGDSIALTPQGTFSRPVALAAGPVGPIIEATLTISSPAGAPVMVDAAQRLTITLTPQAIRVGDISVAVDQEPVAMQPLTLNLSGIDHGVVDRVRGGALLLAIENPFGATGDLTLTIAVGGSPIAVRQLPLAAGSSSHRIPLTDLEIQAMLGDMVLVSVAGLVSAPQPVRLTPSEGARVTAQLNVLLGPKEQ